MNVEEWRYAMRKATGLCLVLLLVAVACGGNGGGSGSNASSGGSAPSQAEAAVEGALPCDEQLTVEQVQNYKVPEADGDYRVALLQVSLQGYYYVGIAYGAEKAAQEAGVEYEMVAASGYASPEQQLAQMEDVLEKGADAIVMAPSDIHGSVPVVEMARAQGLPVVNVSTEVASTDVVQVMQDDYAMGQDAADRVAQITDAQGKGIIIAGPAQATWSRKRTEGFTERVEQEYPDMEIVSTKNQLVDPAEGLRSFEDAIQADPDIDWIYAVHSYILPWKSLPERYRGKVPYVSTGLEPDSMEGLEQGGIAALQGIFPVPMGYMGVGKAVELLNGADLPTYICLPTMWFTPENIDEAPKDLDLFPESYQPTT